jgi:hypothetical protein
MLLQRKTAYFRLFALWWREFHFKLRHEEQQQAFCQKTSAYGFRAA